MLDSFFFKWSDFGILLIILGQVAFGGIGLASAVLIAVIVFAERRKQYQKIDGSFLYNEREVSIHVDIYGKMRTRKPVVLKYGDKDIEVWVCNEDPAWNSQFADVHERY